MLEANGSDFPSDPEAAPNDWLGADACVAARVPRECRPWPVATSPHGGANRSGGDVRSS
jgi:hypothetical protein